MEIDNDLEEEAIKKYRRPTDESSEINYSDFEKELEQYK